MTSLAGSTSSSALPEVESYIFTAMLGLRKNPVTDVIAAQVHTEGSAVAIQVSQSLFLLHPSPQSLTHNERRLAECTLRLV